LLQRRELDAGVEVRLEAGLMFERREEASLRILDAAAQRRGWRARRTAIDVRGTDAVQRERRQPDLERAPLVADEAIAAVDAGEQPGMTARLRLPRRRRQILIALERREVVERLADVGVGFEDLAIVRQRLRVARRRRRLILLQRLLDEDGRRRRAVPADA